MNDHHARHEGGAPLRLRGVVKRFPTFQLGPVDLEVPPGSVTALIGPNGAGKTTLIRLVMGLAAPSAGAVQVLGRVPGPDETDVRTGVGFVPEEPFLYPELTAEWHGRYAAAHFPTWDAALFRRLLDRLGVPAGQKVKELSKGTRVKAELALALAHRPKLLVLDEPTSGIDPLVRGEVLQVLAQAAGDGEGAVLFSTHITEDVDRIADRVVFLVGGQVRLAADRERLRESWQEVWLDGSPDGPARPDDPDADGAPRWARAAGVLRVEPAGAGCVRVLTDDAGQLLAAGDAGCAVRPVRQRPLRLDEILALLVEQGGCKPEAGRTGWPG